MCAVTCAVGHGERDALAGLHDRDARIGRREAAARVGVGGVGEGEAKEGEGVRVRMSRAAVAMPVPRVALTNFGRLAARATGKSDGGAGSIGSEI